MEEKISQIEVLFEKLSIEIASFQEKSTLSCLAGCGKCCSTPEIDASPLEFLPWAFSEFINGNALDILKELKENESSTCFLYRPKSIEQFTSGNCSNYKYRGLICRLFGYGATTDKYGQLRIASCNIIKEEQPNAFEKTTEAINNGMSIPVFTDYYMQLSQIDFKLGNVFVPVNKAMKLALEEVLHYYAYRDLPANYKAN